MKSQSLQWCPFVSVAVYPDSEGTTTFFVTSRGTLAEAPDSPSDPAISPFAACIEGDCAAWRERRDGEGGFCKLIAR